MYDGGNAWIFFGLTILSHLDLIHLQFQPGPIKDLIDEHAPQEDLGEGASEGSILVHLDRKSEKYNLILRCYQRKRKHTRTPSLYALGFCVELNMACVEVKVRRLKGARAD
jgi:hypothetical protein